jgi:hypothetical protein
MIDRTGLTPGQAIELRWESRIGEECVLAARLGNAARGEFAIRLDPDQLSEDLPATGQDVTIRAVIEYGLWVNPGRITEADGAGELRMKLTSPPERLQRRRHERLRMDGRACLAVLLDENRKPKARLSVRLIDLSAGGAQIECSTQVQPDDLVLLVLDVDGGQPIHAVLRIIAAQESAEPSTGEPTRSTASAAPIRSSRTTTGIASSATCSTGSTSADPPATARVQLASRPSTPGPASSAPRCRSTVARTRPAASAPRSANVGASCTARPPAALGSPWTDPPSRRPLTLPPSHPAP